MKKYIFTVIFFFLFAVLSAQGYAIFHLNKKIELFESTNKEEATSIHSEASKPPNSEDDLCLKTESGSKNDKCSAENGDKTSCEACGVSIWKPLTWGGFPYFNTIKDTATTLLDKSFSCKSCGNVVNKDSPPDKVDTTENEKLP